MINRFKKLVTLVVVAVMLIPTQLVGAAPSKNSETDANRWKLVWSDEFDGNALDETKWAYETGSAYNNEQQYYTKET